MVFVTKEMTIAATRENMTAEELIPLCGLRQGSDSANRLHKSFDPRGIGSMLTTKINVNLGVSRDCKDYGVELEKVMSAVNMGADAIMDLSSHGNTEPSD